MMIENYAATFAGRLVSRELLLKPECLGVEGVELAEILFSHRDAGLDT